MTAGTSKGQYQIKREQRGNSQGKVPVQGNARPVRRGAFPDFRECGTRLAQRIYRIPVVQATTRDLRAPETLSSFRL